MEYYVTEGTRPLERCFDDVSSCDVYVGVFGQKGGARSGTRLQADWNSYRRAVVDRHQWVRMQVSPRSLNRNW